MSCAQIDRMVEVCVGDGSEKKNGDRDEKGRFVKGNRGGPGNPFARQVAELRKALIEAVTPEYMQALARKLLLLSLAGNVQAMKLLFSYVLGKPGASVNPDTLAMQEMEQFRQEAEQIRNMDGAVKAPDPELAAELMRVGRECSSKRFGETLLNGLDDPESFADMVNGAKVDDECGDDELQSMVDDAVEREEAESAASEVSGENRRLNEPAKESVVDGIESSKLVAGSPGRQAPSTKGDFCERAREEAGGGCFGGPSPNGVFSGGADAQSGEVM